MHAEAAVVAPDEAGRLSPAPRPARAADLPEGSVVATEAKAWIKGQADRPEMREYCWQPGSWSNAQIDQYRADGAEVLRVGNGKEEAEMQRYTWEVQRERHGLWSHQHILGEEPFDPRGSERSDLPPGEFAAAKARSVAPSLRPGPWRLVVHKGVGVGWPPVAVVAGDGSAG